MSEDVNILSFVTDGPLRLENESQDTSLQTLLQSLDESWEKTTGRDKYDYKTERIRRKYWQTCAATLILYRTIDGRPID